MCKLLNDFDKSYLKVVWLIVELFKKKLSEDKGKNVI